MQKNTESTAPSSSVEDATLQGQAPAPAVMTEDSTSNDETMVSVLVTNVSPAATEEVLRTFFLFCGEVKAVQLDRVPLTDGSLRALVTFSSAQAADTALMLTGANIADRAIKISPMPTAPSEDAPATTPASTSTEEASKNVEENPHRFTHAVSKLLAAGYELSHETVLKAKDFDSKHKITSTVWEKLTAFNDEFRISDRLSAAKEKVSQLNQEYHVSDRATAALNTVSEKATDLKNKLMENDTINRGVTAVSGWLSSLVSSASETVNEVERETAAIIHEDEKKRAEELQQLHQKEHEAVSTADVPADSTTTTTTTTTTSSSSSSSSSTKETATGELPKSDSLYPKLHTVSELPPPPPPQNPSATTADTAESKPAASEPKKEE